MDIYGGKPAYYVDHNDIINPYEIVEKNDRELIKGLLNCLDLERANDYQLKESFVKKAQQLWLHTDGFDSYVYRDGLGHLVYRGRLVLILDD